MIALTNIHKVYTRGTDTFAALHDIYLHVAQGSIVGIVGHSGAGKSTLLRTINMLDVPTCGQVQVGGQDLTRLGATQLREARRRIGMVFQHFNLLASATVYDNIALPLRLMHQSPAPIARRLRDLLRWLDLAPHAHKYPAQLSGGQKQRVGIARAICGDVRVLLCDEATSALDPACADNILELLRAIARELALTVVMVTHDMHVVQSLCDAVVVMDQGTIVERGAVADVLGAPKHAASQRLLASRLSPSRAA